MINTGRAIPLSRLFLLTEYPNDVMALYAQGFSLANYLVSLRGKPYFLDFVWDGQVGGWNAALASYYGIYSTEPGESVAPLVEDVGDAYAAMPRRPLSPGYEGPVTVEACTVAVEHDGPRLATVTTLTPDGRRVFARSHDTSLMHAILADEEICGRKASVADGIVQVD